MYCPRIHDEPPVEFDERSREMEPNAKVTVQEMLANDVHLVCAEEGMQQGLQQSQECERRQATVRLQSLLESVQAAVTLLDLPVQQGCGEGFHQLAT